MRLLCVLAIVSVVACFACLVAALVPKLRGGSLNMGLVQTAFLLAMLAGVCFRFDRRDDTPRGR